MVNPYQKKWSPDIFKNNGKSLQKKMVLHENVFFLNFLENFA